MYQEVVGRILTHILKNDKSDEKSAFFLIDDRPYVRTKVFIGRKENCRDKA